MRAAILLTVLTLVMSACNDMPKQYQINTCTLTLKKGVDGNKPWELPWKDTKAMRALLDSYICEVRVDLAQVDNFETLLKKGDVIKGAQ